MNLFLTRTGKVNDTALNDTALSKIKTGLHLFLQAGACLFVYIYKFLNRTSNLSAFYLKICYLNTLYIFSLICGCRFLPAPVSPRRNGR